MTISSEPGRGDKLLVLALCFAGFAVGYACTYAATSTTFILPLVKEFGWGRLVPSLMYVGAMFGVVIASLSLGRVTDRLGEARTAAGSGVLLALVMAGLSVMSGNPAVAIGLAFLAGLLGAGTGVGLWVAILPKWHDKNLGRALGIAVLGQSAGSVVMPPISAGLIARAGWREAYLGLAAIELGGTLLVAWILAGLLKRRGGHRAAAAVLEHGGTTPRAALRQRGFWLLAAAIFFQSLGMFGVSFHLFPIYHDMGVGWDVLPQVTVALGIGLAAGRLVSGALLDYFEPRLVAMAIFALGAFADAWLATLTSVTSDVTMYIPPLLVGAALGSETDILAYIARRLFGLRHYAVIYNRLLIGFFLGAMAGPLLLGWTSDHLERPRIGLWVLALSCGVAAVIAFLLPSVKGAAHAPSSSGKAGA